MKEEFLHYIWRNRLFSTEHLYFSGQKIEILEIGEHNMSSGPDFFNSKIKIGETVWVGNVEIHIKASDWLRHGHQYDEAYENVVLHMVYENDKQILRANGEEIPTGKIIFNPEVLTRYSELIRLEKDKECFHLFAKMEGILFINWLEKLEFQRLERKVEVLKEILKKNNHHWEVTLYEILAMSFGMKLNAEAFRLLSKMVPLEFVLKNRYNTMTLMACLYGKAGFLEKSKKPFLKDESALLKEYTALTSILPKDFLKLQVWKKMRSMPSGFPEIRIAQFANLVRNTFPLFEKLKTLKDPDDIKDIFLAGIKHKYYEITGLLADNKLLKSIPGNQTLESLIINSTVPLLFYYGKFTNKEDIIQNSIIILEKLRPENNEILKNWAKFGIVAKNAFDSQALIELTTQYCKKQRCLECSIGHMILSSEESK